MASVPLHWAQGIPRGSVGVCTTHICVLGLNGPDLMELGTSQVPSTAAESSYVDTKEAGNLLCGAVLLFMLGSQAFPSLLRHH